MSSRRYPARAAARRAWRGHGSGSVPYRRDVQYVKGAREVPVADVALSFVSDRNWGMLARRGHFEIEMADLERIAAAMAPRRRSERYLRVRGLVFPAVGDHATSSPAHTRARHEGASPPRSAARSTGGRSAGRSA